MQVTHLTLENWRNFTHVDVPLQQRVFVSGPDAAGKSNLLDAFRFLRDLSTPGGGLEKDEIGIPHLEGRYEHWRPNAGWQREDQFSDGTLRLKALLWSVMDGTGPLLIEEPELNLHPAVVRFLPQMLHRATRRTRRTRRQVILSTHSPDFLRDEGIAADETLLLRPDNNGTRVDVAAADPTVSLLLENGASMADAVLPQTAPKEEGQLALMFGD